ncbi:MAG: hypothetical protein ABR549_04040, partial [Mycobacteriales bacterium]
MHWLTEGPRGRRILWELVARAGHHRAGEVPSADTVRAAVAGPLSAEAWSEQAVTGAVADSVSWARYWQEPDETDAALNELGDLLAPVANQVPVPDWWEAPFARDEQVLVVWEGSEPNLLGADAKLHAWADDTVADERRARVERPVDLTVNWSGRWWSAPTMSGLPVTSRSVPGLAWVEDDLGWASAELLPVVPRRHARVLEVHTPEDWVRLVTTYPLEVSVSRRQDWWRATGAREPLYLPDFRAIARDWDGVHVSTRGYGVSSPSSSSPPAQPRIPVASKLLPT